MEKPIDNFEIYEKLNGRTKILKYEDLVKFKNVRELLHPYGNAVILYPGDGGVGHWTCLFYGKTKNGKPTIEFFDPYGFKIEDEFNYTKRKLPHYLSRLLYHTGQSIVYNHHPFQKMTNKIATCGLHCINRIRNRNLSLEKYIELYKDGKTFNSDQLIYLITK